MVIPAGQVSSRIRHLPHAPPLSQAEQSCGGGGEGGGGDGDPTTYMSQLGWSFVIALQQRQPHPACPTPDAEGYMNIVHGGFWAMAKDTQSSALPTVVLRVAPWSPPSQDLKAVLVKACVTSRT